MKNLGTGDQQMNTDYATIMFAITIGVLSIVILIALVIGFVLFVRYENRTATKGIDEQMMNLKAALNAQTSSENGMQAFGQVWLTKHQENFNYYLLLTKQVKMTFALALASAIFGLVLFAFTICTALIFREKLVVAVIPAVSAAIVEVFSGIILAVHRATLKQVSHFNDMSNQDERLYAALMFSGNLSEQTKDSVMAELLKAETANIESAVSPMQS